MGIGGCSSGTGILKGKMCRKQISCLGYATDAFRTHMLAYPFCMTAVCQNEVAHRTIPGTWRLLAEL